MINKNNLNIDIIILICKNIRKNKKYEMLRKLQAIKYKLLGP